MLQLIYTYFTTYLRTALREMYDAKPLQIVDKAQGQLRFHEIVQLGSYESVCNSMVESVFRTLESQKSTSGLLDKLLERTGVSVPEDVQVEAMLYLEMRHLIVHNASVVDEKFMRVYGTRASDAHLGRELNSSLGVARRAVAAIDALCSAVDSGLIRAGYLVPV